MSWHVHFKDGKLAIWSTVVDKYLTDWVDEQTIIAQYVEHAMKEAVDVALINIQHAKERKCSAAFVCKEV